jgi:hypothetical protein
MSLYTNNTVRTHVIDPVYNRSKQRSVFELPNDANILSNLRIGNFGIIANTATTYLGGIGALGCIESIQLQTQDGTVIDQLQNFQLYSQYKQYARDNQRQKDRAPNLSKNQMAMSFGGITNASEVGQKITNYNINGPSRAILTSEALTAQGWFSLSDCLGILRNMPVINTGVMRDLRLIINYDPSLVDAVTDTVNVPFNTTQPFLIADQLLTPLMPMKPVSYHTIEHDSISVPAVAPTSAEVTKVQPISRSLNGFRNKSIQRMLIAKSPNLLSSYQTGGVNMRYGKVASVSCHKETMQISVNGSNIFSQDGLTKENQRLAMLSDVYSECSTYPFANGSAYVELDAVDRNAHIDVGNDIISQLDYYGVLVQSSVSDMKLNFSRTGVYVEKASDSSNITAEASVNQALTLNCFAEVSKLIVPQGNSFVVQYA